LAFAFGDVVLAGGATVDTFPTGFVLTSGTCSNLAAGTTLTATGTGKSITTTRIDQDGAFLVDNSTHATGTATDEDGNTYVWNYSNSFRGTIDESGVLTGTMTDSFVLTGRGPAHVDNGFQGTFVTDFATFFTVPEVTFSHGDPIDFVSGAAHCDPL
jgi:hypothetical protein